MRRIVVLIAGLTLGLAAAGALHAPAARAAGASPAYLMRERLCLLQAYIERYANEHFSYYPPASGVRKGGVLKAPLWPVDPWTGRAMRRGGGIGDFSYGRTANRLGYRLSGRTPSGRITLKGAVPHSRRLQNDHRGREGLELVQQYIEQWAHTHGGRYPEVSEVDATGAVGQQPGIPYWPHDPWVHRGMKQGTSWGDFTYAVSAARDSYTIALHYSLGGTFTLSGAAVSSSPWQHFRLALMDEVVKRDLDIIDGYVRLWAHDNGGVVPAAIALAPGGAVGLAHPDWPVDPYSGASFTMGNGVGHFKYQVNADGSYRLTAPLATSPVPYDSQANLPGGLAPTA